MSQIEKKVVNKLASHSKLPPLNKFASSGVKSAEVEVLSAVSINTNKGRISDEEIAKMRNLDRELVRGIFRYFSSPGQEMKFVFRKYKADPFELYTLRDGEEVLLPRGVAHHLIKDGTVHTFERIIDPLSGRAIKRPKDIKKYYFESTALLDEMKVASKLYTLD